MSLGMLRFALLADGSSDRCLLPILTWLIRQCRPSLALGEPGFRARVTKLPLADEIAATHALFRPDLLFVHRDAEAADPEARRREIPERERLVRVVPVRMTEAWLLFDEPAIRRAADRPDGRIALDLPPLARLESVADPKERLGKALLTAAEATGRHRKRFQQDLAGRTQRVAELIEDFSPLRRLPAFAQLERDCRAVV